MNKRSMKKKKSSRFSFGLFAVGAVGYGAYQLFFSGGPFPVGGDSEKPVKRPWPRIATGGGDQGDPKAPVDSGNSVNHGALGTKNYYVVFDASGSMSLSGCSGDREKMVVAQESLVKFADSVPADANLGMTVFDGKGVREVVPLSLNNREEFKAAVTGLAPGGSTPLKSALALGAEKLEEQAQKQLAYGEYNLVVVTDGEADKDEDPRSVVDDLLLNSPVIVHTVGFCIGEDHSLNQPSKILYKAANQPEQLSQGLEEVLAESESFDDAAFAAP